MSSREVPPREDARVIRRRPVAPFLLAAAGLALLAGLDAGLTLAGVDRLTPVGSARLALLHGPVMVLGFLGTVIALERAVALRTSWAMLAPATCGAGALALVLLNDPTLGRLFLAQGMFTLTCVYVALFRRNRDLTVAVQALGSVLAGCAAMLLTRVEVSAVVPLLIAFIVLTIAAERVELARLAMPATAYRWLLGLAVPVALFALLGLVLPASVPGVAERLLGLALLALTGWLVRHDVARRLVRSSGLPRFSAVAMLLGYLWLACAGAALLIGGRPTGVAYDIAVHATFLGFAMSMVLAHAPVILPAVLRIALPYRRAMWVPLVLLHVTLAGRVLSLLADELTLWRSALVGNVAALLLFVLTAVSTALLARRKRPQAPAHPTDSPTEVPR